MGEKNYHRTNYQQEETKLLSGFPREDRALFKNLLNAVSTLKVKGNQSNAVVWRRVKQQLPEAKVLKFEFRNLLATGVAASLIFILASVAILLSGNIEESTSQAQHKAVSLPDGSEVILNAESQLSYNKYLWKIKRSVRLEGEAFFQVQKGERFDVHSEENVVSVLGTSFNVLARKNKYRVSCFTGKVRVATKQQEVILTPNSSTELTSTELSTPRTFNQKTTGSWKRGDFYFDNASLQQVFETIERQFGVTTSRAPSNRYYTGYFDMSNLDQALKIVCEPMDLTYQVKDKTVTINKHNQ